MKMIQPQVALGQSLSQVRPLRPYATAAMPPLAVQRILRDAVVIFALLMLNKGGNVGAGIFFTIMAAMVLKSPKSAYQALAITWLGLMINQAFEIGRAHV